MEGVETQLRVLEHEGIGAAEAAEWLRVMQRRRASFDAVLKAIHAGMSPSSWGTSE